MREIDLPAYFERIGLTHAPAADLEGMEVLQRAHLLSIPFENLDIALGRGISLDPARVFDKLVTRGRGGYCFEHNLIFLAVLHALGFAARPLIGRVWLMAEDVPGRTHRLNRVEMGGRVWIADVGFGGSLAPVLPLESDHVRTTSDGVRHRFVTDADHGWMLERDFGKGYQRQYSFTLEKAWPIDFVLGNHYTSTAPASLFTSVKMVSIPTPAGFVSLMDRKLRLASGDVREIANAAAYRGALRRYFGIDLLPEEIAGLGLFGD